MSIEIDAEIGHVEYEPTLCRDLDTYTLSDVRSGDALENSSFFVEIPGHGRVAVSQWVTPKRTRSYPYERVYDTLQNRFRATVIPIVKDEGADGDRDYLQWSTISLMSLLNVYVIPAYYADAEKNPDYENKITNQEFDSEYIATKLEELLNYQSDALHWNMREMKNIDTVVDRCHDRYYNHIAEKTEVELSSESAFQSKVEDMAANVERFEQTSHASAKSAQHGEANSVQPTENVMHDKGKITLTNFLGGEYHFTVDEVVFLDDDVILTEKKHTRSTLPSMADIKDGLLKLIIYRNIREAYLDQSTFNTWACLGLTGENITGTATTLQQAEDLGLKQLYTDRVQDVFTECQRNGILCFVAERGISEPEQKQLLQNSIQQ